MRNSRKKLPWECDIITKIAVPLVDWMTQTEDNKMCCSCIYAETRWVFLIKRIGIMVSLGYICTAGRSRLGGTRVPGGERMVIVCRHQEVEMRVFTRAGKLLHVQQSLSVELRKFIQLPSRIQPQTMTQRSAML